MRKDRREEVENIVEHILTNFNYGDTISFKSLERLLGYNAEEIQYKYLLTAVKNELMEYGCILTAVIGEGYRILFPNEVAKEVYRKCAKRSLGYLAKGLKMMENVDRNMLNDEEKRQFEDMEKLVAEMYMTNENSLLKAQFLIGETQRKRLN
jgi:hypothetical protein